MKLFPELNSVFVFEKDIQNTFTFDKDNLISSLAKLDRPYRMFNSSIGDYSYISVNSRVSYAHIGKFCSIGPNFLCGWGIHPIDGLSTSPSFYSTNSYNGLSLSVKDKIREREQIVIGNDVFIGANVTILDGLSIGDGVVIGAGSVVNDSIPPYAIVGGIPAKIIKFRFEQNIIDELLKIRWWEWEQEKLKTVEHNFNNVSDFIQQNRKW